MSIGGLARMASFFWPWATGGARVAALSGSIRGCHKTRRAPIEVARPLSPPSTRHAKGQTARKHFYVAENQKKKREKPSDTRALVDAFDGAPRHNKVGKKAKAKAEDDANCKLF
ncbi:hypothetical protein [Pandoravirus japonicus]|uniref:Uncharacterized protein n=1 Tax=Pandoravirus japonicus TaxID=2823154 RepID=A0A811BRS6_9VIRU|nr:hypothetical protein [Pandoravirus japonicus]